MKNYTKWISFFCLIFVNGKLLNAQELPSRDPNIITKEDLPTQVTREFQLRGRGDSLPQFPEGYGIEEAMESKFHNGCMSTTGKQLTDWKVENKLESNGFYWRYHIFANFECNPPIEKLTISGIEAESLSDKLEGVSVLNRCDRSQKLARILCYKNLIPVCVDNRLIRYQDSSMCELVDLRSNTKIHVIKDDLLNGDKRASDLWDSLEVFVDHRRDDMATGVSCAPNIPGKLKGMERKSAVVSCIENFAGGGTITCDIKGMIKK